MSEEGYRRRLAALLSADVEGYSRLMREDEDTTIRTVTEYRTAITDLVRRYRGRVVDSPGDNILAEFGSVVDAVNCAVEIQRDLAERNLELAENRRMKWRIGVNSGDVVQDGDRIYGDGVNVAARMESLAEGGGICLSGTVYDSIVNKLGLEYEYLGEQAVKNISQPIRAYRVLSYPGAAAHRVIKAKKAESKKWRNIGLAAAAVAIVVAVVVVWYCWIRTPSTKPVAKKLAGTQVKALPLPDKPSIAVLPFVNTSGDPKQDYLSDGITEQLIYALSRVPGLFVIARQSSFFYKGKKVKVQQVGRELGVKYVLEGNMDRSGDRLRITAQLIDAQTGRHLWAARWDRKLKDLFALQDEITLKIIGGLGAKLTTRLQLRFYSKGTANVEACLAVMQGNEQWFLGTKTAIHNARQLAHRAITLDSKYPDAYCLLGNTYFMEAQLGYTKTPIKSLQTSVKLYKKAIDLDKYNDYAYGVLGYVYAVLRRYKKALELANRAINLNPSSPNGYVAKGYTLIYLGRYQEAIQTFEKVIRIDPKGPGFYFMFLGHAYRDAGKFSRAIEAYKKARDLMPNNVWNYMCLAVCYISIGRHREARAAVAKVIRMRPDLSLKRIVKSIPWPNPTRAKRFVEALREAGLK